MSPPTSLSQWWARSRGVIVTLTMLSVIVGMKRLRTTPDRVYEPKPPASILAATPLRFEEDAARFGMTYEHRLYYPNPEAKSYLPLMAFPPAIAIADFDDDGFMDVYVVQNEPGQPNRLYKNVGGTSTREVAGEVGLADADKKSADSMALWADFNRDGKLDLYQSRFGCHTLFLRDEGSLHFTERADLVHGYCSNPKAVNVGDLNRDGWLDLVFGNYYPDTDLASYLALNHVFGTAGANRQGGGSEIAMGTARGFVNAGSHGRHAHTTAVGISDVDEDGWPDLFMSNDYTFDEMYLNQKGRGWADVTEQYIPLVEHGFSGMNSEFADFDDAGHMSLFVSEMYFPPFATTKNILWKKAGDHFVNVADEQGVGRCGWAWTAKFADFDDDGEQDLFVVNGKARGSKVRTHEGATHSFAFVRNTIASVPPSLKEDMIVVPDFSGFYLSAFEKSCVFWHKDGRFYDVATESGVTDLEEGQSAALVDFDNDGKMDVVVASIGAKLLFYRNVSPKTGHWVGVNLIGPAGMKMPFGAKAYLHRDDGKTPMREYYPANGFRGQSDPRMHWGLGESARVPAIEVRWPDGKIETFEGLGVDAYHDVRYGEGRAR